MADVIKLLSDAVANQIAAGEVIQRPASVVKELLENSIDAKATHITLVIKDAGKSLIQVIDNGVGMSDTDARMCFERHATSKIRQASDLFSIKTMGFRGEALASIAAIAHVELKTAREAAGLGTKIILEGSEVKSQEPFNCPVGSTFTVKNLFYNVPARRKFLKSDNIELNHIINEFERVALAYPSIGFTFINQEKKIYQLDPSNHLQRIVAIFGNGFKEILPVGQETDVVKISGFVGKPDKALKSKKYQFFFANNRFIKHPYLHYAIEEAFENLIPVDYYPAYFIYFEVKPDEIDINIHPTKTEVKFENEKIIFAILKAAVRKSLGSFNITPSLDFEISQQFEYIPSNQPVKPPTIEVNVNYNPFKQTSERHLDNKVLKSNINREKWELLMPQSVKNIDDNTIHSGNFDDNKLENQLTSSETYTLKAFQLHNRFILSQIRSGLIIIDIYKANWRIFFEKYLQDLKTRGFNSQQLLFPENIILSHAAFQMLKELLPQLQTVGFDITLLTDNQIEILGLPAEFETTSAKEILLDLINTYEDDLPFSIENHLERLAFALAKSQAKSKANVRLKPLEIENFIDTLFACNFPEIAPDGSKIIKTLTLEEIAAFFNF